ncbi:MAG: hypothetical protein R2713_22380 [Ilumatobacteraceae bacterium]
MIQVKVLKGLGITTPLMQTASHWYTHGFGADLDEAMRGAAFQMLWLMQEHLGLSADDAYSLASMRDRPRGDPRWWTARSAATPGSTARSSGRRRSDDRTSRTNRPPARQRMLWSDHQSKAAPRGRASPNPTRSRPTTRRKWCPCPSRE